MNCDVGGDSEQYKICFYTYNEIKKNSEIFNYLEEI